MDGRIVKGIWIPIEIWEAQDLSWNEKILLMEIDSFTAQGKDCFISDEYVADLINTSIRNASRMMTNLIEKGYVVRTRFDGRRRFVASCLGVAGTPNLAEQTGQNCHTTYNNILIKEDKSSSNNKGKRFDFKQSLIEIGVAPEVAEDWMQVRKAAKATNTETAFNRIKHEIEKSGLSANECITIAVSRSWRGFQADWVANQMRQRPQARISVLDNNRMVAEELMRM